MTLDCLFFRTSFSVKGHFCSFLLSNIIGYLAFLNLDISLFHNSSFLILIFEILFWNIMIFRFVHVCFWCGSIFWSVDISPDLNDFFQIVFSGSFLCLLFPLISYLCLYAGLLLLKDLVFRRIFDFSFYFFFFHWLCFWLCLIGFFWSHLLDLSFFISFWIFSFDFSFWFSLSKSFLTLSFDILMNIRFL